jgi:two-component system response regulator NreC
MNKKIRILVVDDHAVVRKGIIVFLDSQPDMEVVGESGTGRDSIAKVQELNPDVVLMDISMPDLDGIEATRAIKKISPEARIVVLTMHDDARYFFQILKEGALGYVVKGADPKELLSAIRVVFENKAYLLPSLTTQLLDDYLMRLKDGQEEDSYTKLTAREREVLTLIGEGHTSRIIAEMLFISINTVERHRANIMNKLEMNNKAQLIRYAIRKGLVKLDP